MDTKNLIEKIFLLESKVGNKYKHVNFEPFKFESSNAVKVQEVCRLISNHLGLGTLTFIVSYAAQKDRVGGHIQLDNSNEVFIEISDGYKNNSDVVLSILAHEICHKYLHVNNIKCTPLLQNEILTDIATVYTGLGKLSLNGCETRTYISNTSKTETLGYISREEFAFAYKLICTMRNISKQEMFKGLSSSATIVLNEIENKFQSSFETSLFNNSNTISRVDLITNEVLRDTQKGFALLNKNYKIIKEKIVHNSEKEYKEYHKLVKNEYYDILAKTKKIEGSNQYNFIKNLFLLEKANELSKNLVLKKNKLTELNKQISVIANYSLNENNDFLYYFECPECSNKIKLLKKVIANVTCSNCNYKFIINTGVEESSDGLMDKISSFFKL